MTKNRYEIHLAVHKDKTEILPYKIFMKIHFTDDEFKERIKKILYTQEYAIQIYKPSNFSIRFLKSPIYKVKLFPKLTHFDTGYQFIQPYHVNLQEDLLENDLANISFEDLNSAEFVKERIEELVREFLQNQESIYLSI